MYSNMSLNNLNFGDNMNLQNISNRNTHDQVYLNAPYNVRILIKHGCF